MKSNFSKNLMLAISLNVISYVCHGGELASEGFNDLIQGAQVEQFAVHQNVLQGVKADVEVFDSAIARIPHSVKSKQDAGLVDQKQIKTSIVLVTDGNSLIAQHED